MAQGSLSNGAKMLLAGTEGVGNPTTRWLGAALSVATSPSPPRPEVTNRSLRLSCVPVGTRTTSAENPQGIHLGIENSGENYISIIKCL